MNSLFGVGLLALFLFGIAYLTKRRLGVVSLALVSGSVLAELWRAAGGTFLKSQGFVGGPLPPEGLAALVLTLLPPLVLMLRGPAYRSFLSRFGGAFLFTLLGLVLVMWPLRPLLTGDTIGMAVYGTILPYRELILSVGIVVALIDLLLLHAASGAKSPSKH